MSRTQSDDNKTQILCLHTFDRFRPWPIRRRYRCRHCGLVTRLYDGLDIRAFRPVHAHMSVAMRGVNIGRYVHENETT